MSLIFNAKVSMSPFSDGGRAVEKPLAFEVLHGREEGNHTWCIVSALLVPIMANSRLIGVRVSKFKTNLVLAFQKPST